MKELLCIFIGGGLGSILRYLTTCFAFKVFNNNVYGTLGVNIVGCFLIGMMFALLLKRTDIIAINLKLFLTVGFLGGLTTFSTFSFETFTFLKDGKIFQGLGYMILSCILGLIAVSLGFYLINTQK